MICCRGTADEAMTAMRDMMAEAEVDGERDEDATVSCAGRDVRLSGLHVRPVLLAADGAGLPGHRPSAKKIQELCRDDQRADRAGGGCGWTPEEMVGRLNRMLRGWANYFCLGPVSEAYRSGEQPRRVSGSVSGCVGSIRVQGSEWSRFSDQYLHETLGLLRLQRRRRTASRGRTHESLSESRMREIRTSGSMSGRWKRSMVRILRHRQPKGPDTRIGRP